MVPCAICNWKHDSCYAGNNNIVGATIGRPHSFHGSCQFPDLRRFGRAMLAPTIYRKRQENKGSVNSNKQRHEAKNALPGSCRLSMKRRIQPAYTIPSIIVPVGRTKVKPFSPTQRTLTKNFLHVKIKRFWYADVVELADTYDLGSYVVRHAGSSPVIRTKQKGEASASPFSFLQTPFSLL